MALRKWRVQFTATFACIVLAFALGDRPVVDKPPSVDAVCPKVVIRGKEFFVPEHCPKHVAGRLQYDKNWLKSWIRRPRTCFATCASTIRQQHNPRTKIKRRTSSTSVCFATSHKAHMCVLFYCSRFFSHCHRVGVGHGHARGLFLSLISFLLTLQYTVWPGWGNTYTSGLQSTKGHYALKQNTTYC